MAMRLKVKVKVKVYIFDTAQTEFNNSDIFDI